MELSRFLAKAKLGTYASEGEGGERVLTDGCKEMTFQEGEFKYRDRYFGFNPFVGEEVVWRGDRVVWAMNYYGLLLDEAIPAAEVYRFLGRALRQVGEDRPFRGPRSLKEQDLEYVDESEGAIGRFAGVERIFYKGREVYRLDYQGGFVE